MAHNCIVKCCPNTRSKFSTSDEYISFFRLPKSEIMRQGWLQRIGEVKMPSKIEHARICSTHFAEDAFINRDSATIKKSDRETHKRLRRLVPQAVPTLNLNTIEGTTTDQLQHKILQREFVLPISNVIPEINRCLVNIDSPLVVTPSVKDNVLTNVPDVEDNERRKSVLQPDPVVDAPTEWESLQAVASTFPRRSQRLLTARKHRIIQQRQSTGSKNQQGTPRTTKCAKKRSREYYSDEGSPPWKRMRRFIMENLNENPMQMEVNTKDEKPEKRIQMLLERLKYTEDLVRFYKNSKVDDEKKISEAQRQIEMYAFQIKEEQAANSRLLAEVGELKDLNDKLYAKLQSEVLKHSTQTQQDAIASVLQPYFTAGQIRCIVEGRKHIRWSVDDFAAAISLRSVSPKAYRYLRDKLNFPLPSLSSLRRWALARFDISEGFLDDVLTVMREKGKTLSTMERIAVITFDEMSLTHEICFDSKLQKMVGPCGKVQVIMVRGLFGNWRQPIYYKFDQPMTKAILIEAITRLDAANYQVVAATSDMGNRGVWSELGITVDKYFFSHPVKTNEVVYIFADVPHLLKLLRNWYVDDGLWLQGCTEKLTRSILQTIIDQSTPSDLSIAHQLTQRVLDARNNMRQAVWPAARIWSRSVAKVVEWMGKRNFITSKDYQKFSDFILIVNNWFDVHNSEMKYGKHAGVNAYGVDEDNQIMRLVSMTSQMESMRVGSRTKLMPFQEGVIISNASLRGLHSSMKDKFPNDYEYLITRRLQQDVLENFLSYIRAMGATRDHPSAYEFRYRLRWYILGKHSHAIFSNNRNSEADMSASCMSSSLSTATTPREDSERSRTLQLHDGRCKDSYGTSTCNSISLSSIPSILPQSHTLEPDYEHEPDPNEEILLTEELFAEIINLSPFSAVEDTENNSCTENFNAEVHGNLHELDEVAEVQQLGAVCEKTVQDCSAMIADEGLTYVAGYVAHRFRNKYRYLGEPTHCLENAQPNEIPNWLETISRGHLLYPSKELLAAARIVEGCFTNFHGPQFSNEDKVIDKVMLLAISNNGYPDGIPEEVLHCLVRTRTYIRIKEINKKMYAEKEQRKTTKKKKKYPQISKKTIDSISGIISSTPKSKKTTAKNQVHAKASVNTSSTTSSVTSSNITSSITQASTSVVRSSARKRSKLDVPSAERDIHTLIPLGKRISKGVEKQKT